MDLSRYISLAYPAGLLLGLVLAWLYLRRLRNRNLWRALLLGVAVILLCYPSLIHTSKALDFFLLVDRSRSISEEGRAKELEIMSLVSSRLRPGDRLGVVSFNEKAHIEQVSDSKATIQSFANPYSEDASDLTEGLELVLSQVRDGRPSRILILSDGDYTGQDPVRQGHVARQRHVPLFYRNLKRAEVFNLSVRDVDTPDQIVAGEPYRVAFKVTSTSATPGRYRIYRDGRVVGKEKAEGWHAYQFKEGENLIVLNDSLQVAGIHAYRLEVEPLPAERETMRSDNSAERFVKVVGERPLLLVNNTGAPDSVSQILSAGGLKTHIVNVGAFRLGINQLSGYKGIILNNVPVLGLTVRQLEDLRNFVLEEGGGLLVTGGNRSFSAGGYYKSALEPILPVSLEDRQQSKKVSTAFSIVLDRSGSMQIPTPSGQTKIALADNAAVECVNLMSAVDSLSVIAVDSMAHIMVPQQNVENPGPMCAEIRKIESMGGGIFVYTGLVTAGKELLKATQVNKHILLFADANDSEEPGDYQKLLDDYTRAGITVSVVGLGTEHDQDANFLKDVAKRGRGSVYFTEDAAQLVQFFTADTITYTRNRFIQDPAPLKVKAPAYTIAPDQRWRDFTCAGYNLLFSKPKADVALLTADEDHAPALAFWQRGLGRVAALALDANGPFTASPQYGDIMLSSARWVMGSSVDDNLQIRVGYEGNYARLNLEVSEQERERLGAATLQLFTPGGKTVTRPLNWDSLNRLSAEAKLSEPGCYRGVIQLGGQTFKIPPVSLPVSPEFLHDREPDFGRRALAQLAALTGGREILDVRDLFERSTRTSVTTPVLLPFLIAFILLMLLEIAEPRFGLLPWLRRTLTSAAARAKSFSLRRRPALARSISTGVGESAAQDSPLRGRRRKATPAEIAGSTAPPDPGLTEPTPSPESASAPPPDMDYLSRSKLQSGRNLRLKSAPERKDGEKGKG